MTAINNGSINSFFGWMGGKSLLRKEIAKYIPEQYMPLRKRKIKYYIEVFGGMAWLLFYKPKWFKMETYNDLNRELTNLFNVVKYHPEEFLRQFEFLPICQETFEYFKNNEMITDIQKAVQTYYKYEFSFSNLGDNFVLKNKDTLDNIIQKIKLIHNRIKSVVICNLSFEELLQRFNQEDVFAYLDPPYFDKEYYEKNLITEEHKKLCDILKNFKGKFLMSYNNVKEIKELYKDFTIKTINAHYFSVQKKVQEILIANYDLESVYNEYQCNLFKSE